MSTTKQARKTLKYLNLPYGDKSITHRALICAALSDGKCTLTNAALNADTYATISCLNAIGAKITVSGGGKIEVNPVLTPNTDVVLNCLNSGTTARMLAGVAVGLNIHATFIGDESLSKRPMQRVIRPLTAMGGRIEEKECCLFEVFKHGELHGIDYEMPSPSAQVKSAILLAGLFAKGKTSVKEAFATRNHTELMLKRFSADVSCADGRVSVSGCFPLKATDVDIPNDFSTAAVLIAMHATDPDGVLISDVGLNPTRTAFLEWLRLGGAEVNVTVKGNASGENVGDVYVNASALRAVNSMYALSNKMIDEVPLACLMAATAQGNSRFEGLGELTKKESDRLAATEEILNSYGVKTECDGNDLTVFGGALTTPDSVVSTDDHRMAMLNIAASSICEKPYIPHNSRCIDVSCPNFLRMLGNPYRWGLFGTDVTHSLSPLLYKVLCSVTGVKAEYSLFNLSEKEFDSGFKNIFSRLDGANLTMPFKTVLTGFDAPVNTLLNLNGTVVPFNTDGFGLINALKDEGVEIKDKNLLILGCGGTAKEAVRVLTFNGARVTLRNRTASKVEGLKKLYPLQPDDGKTIFDGVLSFLPPTDGLALVTDRELKSADFAFDACYVQRTVFFAHAVENCRRVIGGENMLFWQGVKNFEIWTNMSLTEERISAAKKMFFKEIRT